eukprot:Platyproteum_vivax@DN7458_c0_g1_i7.p1
MSKQFLTSAISLGISSILLASTILLGSLILESNAHPDHTMDIRMFPLTEEVANQTVFYEVHLSQLSNDILPSHYIHIGLHPDWQLSNIQPKFPPNWFNETSDTYFQPSNYVLEKGLYNSFRFVITVRMPWNRHNCTACGEDWHIYSSESKMPSQSGRLNWANVTSPELRGGSLVVLEQWFPYDNGNLPIPWAEGGIPKGQNFCQLVKLTLGPNVSTSGAARPRGFIRLPRFGRNMCLGGKSIHTFGLNDFVTAHINKYGGVKFDNDDLDDCTASNQRKLNLHIKNRHSANTNPLNKNTVLFDLKSIIDRFPVQDPAPNSPDGGNYWEATFNTHPNLKKSDSLNVHPTSYPMNTMVDDFAVVDLWYEDDSVKFLGSVANIEGKVQIAYRGIEKTYIRLVCETLMPVIEGGDTTSVEIRSADRKSWVATKSVSQSDDFLSVYFETTETYILFRIKNVIITRQVVDVANVQQPPIPVYVSAFTKTIKSLAEPRPYSYTTETKVGVYNHLKFAYHMKVVVSQHPRWGARVGGLTAYVIKISKVENRSTNNKYVHIVPPEGYAVEVADDQCSIKCFGPGPHSWLKTCCTKEKYIQLNSDLEYENSYYLQVRVRAPTSKLIRASQWQVYVCGGNHLALPCQREGQLLNFATVFASGSSLQTRVLYGNVAGVSSPMWVNFQAGADTSIAGPTAFLRIQAVTEDYKLSVVVPTGNIGSKTISRVMNSTDFTYVPGSARNITEVVLTDIDIKPRKVYMTHIMVRKPKVLESVGRFRVSLGLLENNRIEGDYQQSDVIEGPVLSRFPAVNEVAVSLEDRSPRANTTLSFRFEAIEDMDDGVVVNFAVNSDLNGISIPNAKAIDTKLVTSIVNSNDAQNMFEKIETFDCDGDLVSCMVWVNKTDSEQEFGDCQPMVIPSNKDPCHVRFTRTAKLERRTEIKGFVSVDNPKRQNIIAGFGLVDIAVNDKDKTILRVMADPFFTGAAFSLVSLLPALPFFLAVVV